MGIKLIDLGDLVEKQFYLRFKVLPLSEGLGSVTVVGTAIMEHLSNPPQSSASVTENRPERT